MFLSKPVDEELGNQLVATMLYLDSENKKDINLYINCSGGDVSHCLLLCTAHLSAAQCEVLKYPKHRRLPLQRA